jgi:hypothetical protein
VTSGCGIYMCGAAGACATSCAGDFDCVGGYICQGGVCTARGMTAAPCTATAQCAAGLTCKDGVCCESACDKACRSCAIPGQVGHCALVASADDPDSCAAETRTCDAAGACKLKAGQTNAPPEARLSNLEIKIRDIDHLDAALGLAPRQGGHLQAAGQAAEQATDRLHEMAADMVHDVPDYYPKSPRISCLQIIIDNYASRT